jgi:hypothetical protein
MKRIKVEKGLKANWNAIKNFQGLASARSYKIFGPFTCILNCNHLYFSTYIVGCPFQSFAQVVSTWK